jgi:spoIIIJ-associated protein
MMDWVETTGKTVEEAKKSALYQLGVPEADAEFEVVAEAKVGLFGRLKEEARVRARVQPRYPRSKNERRERRRSRAGSSEEPKPSAGGTRRPSEPGSAGAGGSARAEAPERGQGPGGGTPGGRRKRSAKPPAGATQKPAATAANFGNVEPIAPDAQAQLAEDFLHGLLAQLGAAATIGSRTQSEGAVEVEISGENLGMLIGPKGSTLAALQELARIVVQRHAGPSETRLVVDVNGYRKRRQEALARFAHQVAAEVRESGNKRALEPMPPADRKVVHDAINSVEGVTTISEGEEPNRRVVLLPASTVGAPADGSAESAGTSLLSGS